MRRCHKKQLLILGYGSLGLLIFCLFALLLPTCPTAVSASVLRGSATTDVSTTVVPSISIALGSKVDLVVDQFDQLITSSSQLTVTTNSREGYSLYLSTTGDDNNLHGQNKDNTAVISPIAKDTTAASFTSNSWGYRLNRANEDNLYQPVPATSDTVADSTTAGNATTQYSLTFATKIDATLPTDTYYNSVLVSAVANPVAVASLSELLYMQDMTPAICSNTMDYVDKDHYIEKQVIDVRDGKSYWVAKLADGNCWMVQNLGLTFGAGVGKVSKLTAVDSDVASDWMPPETEVLADPSADSGAIMAMRSWSFGDIAVINPTNISSCPNAAAGDGREELAACDYVQDVTGWTPEWVASETSSIDLEGKQYDAHYLLGNYYQWN